LGGAFEVDKLGGEFSDDRAQSKTVQGIELKQACLGSVGEFFGMGPIGDPVLDLSQDNGLIDLISCNGVILIIET
jgi:hypothetical protein